MMSLTSLNRIVFGMIAFVLGVTFWVAAPKQVTVAGDVTSYSSTWEPQDYLIARRFRTPIKFDEIVLGVATWKVRGNFGAEGPFFKEVWQSPSDTPVFNLDRTMTPGVLGNWIAGAIWPKNLEVQKIEIIKKNSESTIEIWPPTGNGAKID